MSDQDLVRNFDVSNLSVEFLDDPFPTYRALRELDPVHQNSDGSYFLTRYADLNVAYKNKAMSSDKKVDFKPNFGDSPLYVHHTTSLVFNDDPYHARVRRLLAAAFTPRKLNELKPIIETVTSNLLDKLAEQKEFDLMDDYALVLPTEIIANMLGIDDETRPLLHNYSNKILGALDPAISKQTLDEGNDAVTEFGDYLAGLIKHRRANPDEGGQGEVLAALIFGEVNGETLSDVELVQNCIFLLNAGHETTANLTANGIGVLLDYPDQFKRLVEDSSLIETAVNEFLRFDSPVQLGNRKLTDDVEIGGKVLKKDTYLHLALGGANRDPDVFDDPESVDIGRKKNPHFAFASGRHICLGNTLSRIEGCTAIGKLIERFPGLRPNGERQRLRRARFRGYAHFPVAVS